ncbi:phosphosulfolactate synthase [Evansella cellulosilytica]|uniref:Phosphosulfolactate synthase n=1 Tax=Evansella cellulosilytica (strain ATCC 21833 / DSM 2522 / FERM P-1141 / JCM 9156 / N-4) TaxID=649639 RepID=E6TZS3_EVAC2|nr:phosphosulfolactate synthase [Evansella cellulosilytica]ADU31379.1 Phosphosulfolactate synthase [Evansella cellulosilytica DSM 2522]
MNISGLNLPLRDEKPRQHGLTVLIDNGLPIEYFKDMVNSSAEFIDFIKFGWGTSIVTGKLIEKIECLKENNIDYFFGGTLFEKFLSQGKLDQYYLYCKKFDCKYIEISNGTMELTNKEKANFISEFSEEFNVFSEVGQKDADKADETTSSDWIEFIKEDFEAGATKVITEARESGTSGLCKATGEVRMKIVEDILTSSINIKDVIFEAPNKTMQSLFIKYVGSNVNLANISFSDTIPLETLRLGLRSDTFYLVNFDWGSIREGQK